MSASVQSTAASYVKGIAGNVGLDAKTKDFLLAALACCGNASHGKGYAPAGVEFSNWKVGDPNIRSPVGLNCWTAVLFWAFQGGAISAEWITEYAATLKSVAGQMEAENKIMYSYLRANQATDIATTTRPTAGCTVFFGDTGWIRPMNHVVVSLGDGRVVSQQSLFAGVKGSVADEIAALNPTIDKSALFAKGLTHISTIELIARGGEDTPRIRALAAPFWTLARVPWVG